MMISMGAMAMALAGEDPAYDRAVAAVQARMALIDQVEDAIPGRGIVMVRAGDAPIVDVKGVTSMENGVPMDGDTPIYIASMTKAYTGLMAAQLDAKGIFSLDTTLGSLFPDMAVEGVDFDALTMRDLLSHQVGFRAVPLNLRTAYTDEVPIDAYTAIVNASGAAIDEAFRYDNLGYLLYTAALEKKTGRSWRAWIDDMVFEPLGMRYTSARTSDFVAVSQLHERYEDGWRTYPSKTDAIMHSAGGLVISANDMGRWLKANLEHDEAIAPSAWGEAQSVKVAFDMEEGGMRCTGYALGWRQCELMGTRFFEHGGGYTGMRSIMMIMPEQGVGFSAMFNSDSMTGGLSAQLAMAFLGTYVGEVDRLPDPKAFEERYRESVLAYRTNRSQREREAQADAAWGGFSWQPSATELLAYGGTYVNEAMGALRVVVDGDRLAADLNGMPVRLRPAQPDLFEARLATSGDADAARATRDEQGRVVAFDHSGFTFTRAD